MESTKKNHFIKYFQKPVQGNFVNCFFIFMCDLHNCAMTLIGKINIIFYFSCFIKCFKQLPTNAYTNIICIVILAPSKVYKKKKKKTLNN